MRRVELLDRLPVLLRPDHPRQADRRLEPPEESQHHAEVRSGDEPVAVEEAQVRLRPLEHVAAQPAGLDQLGEPDVGVVAGVRAQLEPVAAGRSVGREAAARLPGALEDEDGPSCPGGLEGERQAADSAPDDDDVVLAHTVRRFARLAASSEEPYSRNARTFSRVPAARSVLEHGSAPVTEGVCCMRFPGRLAVIALLLLVSPAADAQSFLDWNGLKAGPYPVGFRAVATTDTTRTWQTPLDYRGRPRPGFGNRPIQVSIWYPAETASLARSMTYGDYVDLLAWEIGPAKPGAGAGKTAREQFQRMSGLPVTAEGIGAFEKLYGAKVRATRDARPAPGRFPSSSAHPDRATPPSTTP